MNPEEMKRRQKEKAELFQKKSDEQKALLSKGDEITAEDILNAEKINTELDALKVEIKAYASFDTVAGKAAQNLDYLNNPMLTIPHPSGQPMNIGILPAGETVIEKDRKGGLHVKQVGEGMIDKKTLAAIGAKDYKSAYYEYIGKGWNGLTNEHQKALQEGSDSAGGFLVPEDSLNEILMRKPTPTRLAGHVRSFNTTRDALTLPKVNYYTDDLYATGIRASFSGEIPASSTAHRVVEPQFGSLRIPVYTVMMSLLVSNDFIEDSAVDVVTWAEGQFADTIELLYDNIILNGTGVAQPGGLLLNPGGQDQPAVITSGNANLLTADGLENIAWSMPEQYDDNAKFIFAKTTTGKQIATLKDTQQRYLWGSGLQDSGIVPGIKDRVLVGYPCLLTGFAPAPVANAYPIVFGDLMGYGLVRRIGFSTKVITDLYAETNQTLILGRMRFGGGVIEPWRLKIQQVAP